MKPISRVVWVVEVDQVAAEELRAYQAEAMD
jgi:hypothetical protein